MKYTALLSLFIASAGLAFANVSETITKNFPITADGSFKLSNVNGSIKINSWDKNEIAIVATKEAPDQENLDGITISFDTSPSAVEVVTHHAKKWLNNNRGKVTYEVQLPAGVKLDKISTVNSSVNIEGVSGPITASTVNGSLNIRDTANKLSLSTVNGSIDVVVRKLDAKSRISAETVNGSCTFSIPADSNVDLNASTVNGRVRCDLPITIESSSRSKLHGTIGSGGAELHLSAVNGSLNVEKH